MKYALNLWPQVTNGMGPRRLIRATLRRCTSNGDEKVEENAERSDAKNNRCDGCIDLPQIAREGAAEEQQSDLQHQW